MTAADAVALDLLRRCADMLVTFESPDGKHKALRSQYSDRGVCETKPKGQHSDLCLAYRALFTDVEAYLYEHAERQVPLLLEAR
jgi:hypothetical protein